MLDEQALQPDDRHANWLSQGVEDTETIQLESSDKVKINREGIVITNGQLPSGSKSVPHFLYPLSEEKVWQVGVEHLARSGQQVLLLLQVSEQDALGNLRPLGYAVYDIAPNSSVRYGTFEYDLL